MSEPILPVGKQSGICVHDGNEWRKVKGDADGHVQVDVVNLLEGIHPRRGTHHSVSYDAVPGDTLVHWLVDVTGRGVLEWLGFASTHRLSRVYIMLDGSYTYSIHPPTPSDQPYHCVHYLQYGRQVGAIMELVVYDASLGYYSMVLRRPLFFNSSLRIGYRAYSATDKITINCGYYL